jgi:pyrroline-5-carboxylate reductase
MRISVIGAGVMGEALIAALIKAGHTPDHIEIIEKRQERCDELVTKYSIKVGHELNNSDVVLLVTKPQDIESVLAEINGKVKEGALLVSFAAGKKIATISNGVNGKNPVVRVMPNTPTLVGKGAAGFSLGEGVTDHQKKFVIDFLGAAGIAVEVEEELQDAVTATSGSGPAYFFAFVESMVKGAKDLGLSEEVATQLTVQTIIGAAELLATSGKSATTLRENVTSPNGTTFAALQAFAAGDLNSLVAKAMKAARDRSIELS